MGGIICAIPHLAIMADDTIPTNPSKLADFDARLRQCCAQSEIVQGLVEAGHGDDVCNILKKPHFEAGDRQALCTMLDSLYDD